MVEPQGQVVKEKTEKPAHHLRAVLLTIPQTER